MLCCVFSYPGLSHFIALQRTTQETPLVGFLASFLIVAEF
jgi:hypothetical protein